MPALAISRRQTRLRSRRAVAEWPTGDNRVVRAFADGETRWLDVSGVASFSFGTSGAVIATAEMPHEELIRDTWLRSVLPLVVQARGRQVLHASAVRSRSGGIVAFCGRTGAGKSTMAALLRRAGHEVVADDALGIAPSPAGVTAIPLPFRLRLRDASSAHLGAPSIAFERDQAPAPGPLRRVVLLERAAEPSAETVAPSDAFAALMAHAYCFELESSKEDLISTYAHLCAEVPVTRLAYPHTFDLVDRTVASVEALLEDA